MGKIYIKNLGFDYNGIEVFDGFNTELDVKWKIGLVGKNGKGKTTLLKLLAEKYLPSKGEIIKDIKVSYFPFEIVDKKNIVMNVVKDMIAPFRYWQRRIEELLTKGDAISLEEYGEIEEKFRSLNGYEIEALIKKELEELELEESILNKEFQILSGGEQTKLMLIALFLRKDNYILIDEPTNHLDIYSREIVAKYLNRKSGFICVSHDRFFMDQIADHILSIEKTGLELSKTSYSNWETEKILKEESEHKKNLKLKKDISKLTQSMYEKEKWSSSKEKQKSSGVCKSPVVDRGYIGHKAAKLMQRAKNIEGRIDKQITEMKSLLKNYEKEYELKFYLLKKSGKKILTINNLNIEYSGNHVIENFNLHIEKGDRVALIGKNGCGKSSIINSILKKVSYNSGVIHMHGDQEVVYASQDFNLKFSNLREYLQNENINESEFRNILACFGVKEDIFYKTSSEFSEGERKKIQLTKSMLNESSLLIWDEPLNYLDVSTRRRLEEAILKYKPTMLFIEHDKYFVESVATRIIRI